MVEAPKVTQQNVFEFIDRHMSRDFNESEILGLQKLIKEFGPAEVKGRVLKFLSTLQNEPIGTEKLDLAIEQLEDDGFGIHDLLRREIEFDNEMLELGYPKI